MRPPRARGLLEENGGIRPKLGVISTSHGGVRNGDFKEFSGKSEENEEGAAPSKSTGEHVSQRVWLAASKLHSGWVSRMKGSVMG